MRTYVSKTWFAGCTSFALLSACAPTGDEDSSSAGSYGSDAGLDDKKADDVDPSAVIGLRTGTTLVQGLLMQPYESAGGTLQKVGFPLPIANLNGDTIEAALEAEGIAASGFSGVEFEGYLAMRMGGAFKFKLESENKDAEAILKVDVDGDGTPDDFDKEVDLDAGEHAFSLWLSTDGEVPRLKKVEGEMKKPAKAKFKPLPDAIFAREPDVTCDLSCPQGEAVDDAAALDNGDSCASQTSTITVNQAACDAERARFAVCCVPDSDTGDSNGDTDGDTDGSGTGDTDSDGDGDDAGGTGGGDSGDTDSDTGGTGSGDTGDNSGDDAGGTGGGDSGDSSGGERPAWCIGEDTDERPERDAPKGYCDICGGREFRTENWQDGKGCIERYTEVAFSDTDSPQCQAFIDDMRGYCCDGFWEDPMRAQCTQQMGPYEPVDLCNDGCFPSNPATAGVYSTRAGGPLAPFVNRLGDRRGTCYQDDGASPDAIVWTCRRAYYLLKYGHLPPHAANEVISWWSGHHALSANCGCDQNNTRNPDN